ncbi:hypothetical protein CHH48_13720 [Terribacillus saccharophilus]|uniref:Uncharacterized protein n=1 Tax=Terribacillus saccharophilus TaxID=361277 RepID=A0ABX4GVP8_9BACI|nr:hypothetical protein CHH56_12590 [Terribacillus saccharophilus]PAD95373.1 hypothetical protein CHH50_12825 [Terribacillus saccharophilus]PAD98951.1 hypothetical protein CHH48_13720 [Terribacillus saccharophilus]
MENCHRELPEGARQSEKHPNSSVSAREEMPGRLAAVISFEGELAFSPKKSGTTMSIVSLGDGGHFFI